MAKKIEKLAFPFYAVTETNGLANGSTFRKRGFDSKADAIGAVSEANKLEAFKVYKRTYLVTREEIESGKVIL